MQTIEALHAEWTALGAAACSSTTNHAYADLKVWEAAHADRWQELVRYDLKKKEAAEPK